jgi:ABC-type lipoprotein release transport system permease subunit
MTFIISWKNVWRNKLRSGIIILAIAIGLFGGIFSNAFFMGMVDQRVNSAIKYETSNLQIHNPAFLMDESINNGIANADQLLNKIAGFSEIKGVSLRLTESGMAGTAEANAGVIVNGIHPEQEQKVTQIQEVLIEGDYLKNTDLIGILIGKKLSEKLNADLGDKIVLSMADGQGEVVYGAFKVKGIYDTQNHMFDGVQVFVNYTDLQNLLKTPESYYTKIAIGLHKNEETIAIKNAMGEKLHAELEAKEIKIQDWSEIDPTLKLMVQSMDYFAWFFIGIILMALAFGIINTMVMVVMERTREIGMLMAIGMNKRRIFSMILWETVFLSFVGAMAGMLFSALSLQLFMKTGLDLSMVGEGMNAYGIDTVIYPKAEFSFYITVGIMVFITALISSVFPARYALKLQPANAVRE